MAAKSDSTKKEEQQLCFFYGDQFSFTEICSLKRNLRTLIVIGQPSIGSLDGISELINLRELWVVECQIKETTSLEGCKNLEKLYLYSNQLEKIPNIIHCVRLTVFNLAGNCINRLRNFRGLVLLEELNLANNNLKRLEDVFPRTGNLHSVNFAGNPLFVLKDIKSLRGKKKLEFVIFSDPLYGECPLVRLCYYRYHVINCLPDIKELDHYDVSDEERHLANHFIREKKMLYNVLWHTALNDYWATQEEKYQEYYKEVSIVKSKLEIEKLFDVKFEDQNFKEISEAFSNLRAQYEYIEDWENKDLEKLEVFQNQLQLKFQYSGNVDFIECKDNVIQTCQSLLEDSLCQSIKNLGIKGVTILRVTKIKNNGIKAFQSLSCPIEDSSSDTVLLFFVSPSGDLTIKKWPFQVCENHLIDVKEIWLSDCLSGADANFRNFSSENLYLKKCERSLETRVCVLIECPNSLLKGCENTGKYKNVHITNNKICREFCILEVEKVKPIFVIEYNYQFEKRTSKNNTEIQLPLNITSRDLNIDINFQFKTNEELQNLTTLNLSHQGLARIKLKFALFPNLRELNLSCNHLTKLPDAEFLKYLRVLNISFNQIKFLNVEEKLFRLEKLDISWNNITEYVSCIQTFEQFFPNIKELNTEYNPFRDIFESAVRATVARIYLPDLKIFDGLKIDAKIANGLRSTKSCNKSINVFDKVIKASSAVYKINGSLRSFKSEKNSLRIQRLNLSGNLIRHMDFTVEFPALQELCISNNILSQVSIKPLRNLVKLNLSSNFIKNTDGLKKEILPVLRYLDLSNNLVSSLLAMGNHESLKELYCYQNQITELSEIFNLRRWNELRVVDFSNNAVMDSLCRTFLICHLSNIKYVNGELVEQSDILEAKNEFSGSLNKMTLMTLNSLNHFQNIKELSIVSCSIKKVNLPLDCLPNLESLDLRKNQISDLWGLHLLPKLKTLCLSYNRVELFNQTDYEKNVIDIFPNLITLYLDHNEIRSLQNLELGKCLKLKHLFLQYNYLQDIDGLQDSENLETLVLDYNEIRTITVENFDRNNNLKILFLENNRIKYLSFAKNLHKIQTLLLANNKIADQNHLKELSLLCNLREISLLGNPLCKKTRNHYKFVLQFLDNLSVVDGIEILMEKH